MRTEEKAAICGPEFVPITRKAAEKVAVVADALAGEAVVLATADGRDALFKRSIHPRTR